MCKIALLHTVLALLQTKSSLWLQKAHFQVCTACLWENVARWCQKCFIILSNTAHLFSVIFFPDKVVLVRFFSWPILVNLLGNELGVGGFLVKVTGVDQKFKSGLEAGVVNFQGTAEVPFSNVPNLHPPFVSLLPLTPLPWWLRVFIVCSCETGYVCVLCSKHHGETVISVGNLLLLDQRSRVLVTSGIMTR